MAGLLRLDGGVPAKSLVLQMIQALRHRGPDDVGEWSSGPVCLGNCRLSIIGIDGRGHQPLTNEDGSVVITLNGEVYNYRELRSDLQASGHVFHSATDTEVIVHAYEEWGIDHFLDRVNGMFAFALWDDRRRRLVLARDRLGVKRMYLRASDTEVAFASEIGALRLIPGTRTIDARALNAYLALGYVPEPATIWSSITVLEPGVIRVWEGGAQRVSTYWRLRENALEVPAELPDAARAIRHALGRAVKRQLVSDVPVGVFLSGGLDSLAIATFAVEASIRPTAFTVGFDEPDFDETRRAAQVADFLGLDHRVEVLRPEAWPTVVGLAQHFGQPFADSSAAAASIVSSVAARAVKVVLTGDGGDELFGGYETYTASEFAKIYARLPRGIRAAAARAADSLPIQHGRPDFAQKVRRFTAVAGRQPAMPHAYWRECFAPAERHELLGNSNLRCGDCVDELLAPAVEAASTFHGLNRFLAFDVLSYLPSDMLFKLDIASMMHSLEARVPFLDHELVELAFSVRPVLKRRGVQGKRILREALRDLLPPHLLRQPKLGFNVPVARWLAGPLRAPLNDLLDPASSVAMKFFDADYVSRLKREHESREQDHSFKLWALMIFAIWCDAAKPN